MRRPWLIWLAFAACVAPAAAMMARVHATATRLERAEARARRRAALEDDIKLALWRMDSALAPLIAEESARPYFAYGAFYPAERAFTCMFAEIRRGDVLVPSPLLTDRSPRVLLHFQIGPDGRLASPQVPDGDLRVLATSRSIAPERMEEASRRLAELARWVRRDVLAAALPEAELPPEPRDAVPTLVANVDIPTGPAWDAEQRGSKEYQMRSINAQKAQAAPPTVATRSATVSQGPLRAIWAGPALILARRVRVEEGTFLQGCWLDWEALRAELLGGVADLLPRADLEPVPSAGESSPIRMLAALPVRIVPGVSAAGEVPGRSPVSLSLGIAWAGLAVAAAAVALLLHGAVSLSERRATFVSAVTHELRTPLTTFRLYTEMLAEGMVADPDAIGAYLATLRAEADRLGHLVENVLAFARLERGRTVGRREALSAAELLERLGPPLAARALRDGMELRIDNAAAAARLRTDVSVVDQILSNLVDNACKYARGSPDGRVHLEASLAGGWLALAVRDHGPGVPARVARRLFRPFSKSARDAAHSAPGVGLGLALSRRLARALGGDLRLQQDGRRGACFRLALPLGG